MLGGRATLNTFNTTGNNNGNNNNRLFMAPHFIRAQSPYKDGSIIMFITHTCTNTHAQTHTQVGIMGRKQQISMQKRTCLATSNNLLLMLQNAPKRIFFHKLAIFWSAKKKMQSPFFPHPPSPFPSNFCNCNNISICTAFQFQVQLPLLHTA